jgi:hypothetical protein
MNYSNDANRAMGICEDFAVVLPNHPLRQIRGWSLQTSPPFPVKSLHFHIVFYCTMCIHHISSVIYVQWFVTHVLRHCFQLLFWVCPLLPLEFQTHVKKTAATPWAMRPSLGAPHQERSRPKGDVLLLLTHEESAERFTFTWQHQPGKDGPNKFGHGMISYYMLQLSIHLSGVSSSQL